MLIREDVAYHDYEGVAVDLDERERLVADIGDKGAMLLRNHGTLTVGETVGEAFIRLYFLERACQAQLLALSAGEGNIHNPPIGTPEVTHQQSKLGHKTTPRPLPWPATPHQASPLAPTLPT